MKAMDQKTILSIVVIFAFFTKGEALKCYECSSHLDARCRDPRSSSMYLWSCIPENSQPMNQDLSTCITITYQNSTSEMKILRGCSRSLGKICDNLPIEHTFRSCIRCNSSTCNNVPEYLLPNLSEAELAEVISDLDNQQSNCMPQEENNHGNHSSASAPIFSTIFLAFFLPFSLVHIIS